jgi:hypothetical protein
LTAEANDQRRDVRLPDEDRFMGVDRGSISPELVLVDPVLRETVLAGLLEEDARAEAEAARAAARRPPVPIAPAPARPRPLPQPVPPSAAPRRDRSSSRFGKALRTSAAVPGLVGLSIFVALGVSEARVSEPTLGPAPSASVPSALPRQTGAKPPAVAPRLRQAAPARPAAARRSSAAVEQDVLTRIVRSPAGKVPRALIDPATGLAKNNLQATCRAASAPGEFLCLVRPAAHAEGEGLTVHYRRLRGGGAKIIWGRYRGA